MATLKQKKAIGNLVETRGNVSQAMLLAGYDPTSAKNPKNLTESKAFKEVCQELGLTDELVVGALVEDIKTNKGKRVAELALAAKIMGLEKAPEQPQQNPIRILLMAYGLIEGENNDTKIDGAIQATSQDQT